MPASIYGVTRVHDVDYINYIIVFKEGMPDIDTAMSEGSLDAAFFAAGSATTGGPAPPLPH